MFNISQLWATVSSSYFVPVDGTTDPTVIPGIGGISLPTSCVRRMWEARQQLKAVLALWHSLLTH
ncbi:hypothetical protein F442_18311 [Phytophthora nicotianae P10297]|uniref:Uncharacterized protein n=1 Tax=Phytophthora nicotianae P10297 TaxID=1317064 RepID=W2YDF4_PHYNI|nr:hypothetical protein F442_18311 [Phytophthora nicotianae P10297]